MRAHKTAPFSNFILWPLKTMENYIVPLYKSSKGNTAKEMSHSIETHQNIDLCPAVSLKFHLIGHIYKMLVSKFTLYDAFNNWYKKRVLPQNL